MVHLYFGIFHLTGIAKKIPKVFSRGVLEQTISELHNIAPACPVQQDDFSMRVLGIDYGSKRIGLALGDTESRIASPWGVLSNEGTDKVIDALSELMDREDAEKLVVGVPMLGRKGETPSDERTEIEEFIAILRTSGFEVETVDESFSTKLAATLAEEAGDREKRDDLAAQAILQTWLEKQGKKKKR